METVLLVILAVAFAGAGVMKLFGLGPTVANFERWRVPEWSRTVVGAVEIGITTAAIWGLLGSAAGTQLAALLALWVMVGAIVVHGMAGDKPKETAPAIVLLVVAIALLATTT
jgi:uncharacterized membrane protein YphA (DoxX/SURF4 family)